MEVMLIDSMGGDASVIAAARVSTQGDRSLDSLTKDPEEAKGLINYLMKNRHGTPFEHNACTIFTAMPIFVFREFHRHRIGWSYNEESARYKQLEPKFYVPSPERPGMMQVEGGRPGQYQYEDADPELALHIREAIHDHSIEAYQYYENLLRRGVAKEVARMVLPVNIFSSQYATCNARSLMAFLSLRTKHPAFWQPIYAEGTAPQQLYRQAEDGAQFPSKPQWEINRVADKIEAIFAELMPITYQAFCDAGRVAP
jgi:thymidylate synthase (FAD)